MTEEGSPESRVEDVLKARGYALPLHRVLATQDPEVLQAYEGMMEALYLKGRGLEGKTKELVYVAVLVALGAAEEHVRAHMERALRQGASPTDVLETVELLIPAAGVGKASVGFEIWQRLFGRVTD